MLGKADWYHEHVHNQYNNLCVILVIFKHLKKTVDDIEVICVQLDRAHQM